MRSLLDEVRACQLCADFLPLGPRPVLQASVTARILIAAQAPGRRVHETGVPFDDPSGVRLRQWLGITPEVFYDAAKVAILPMGFCYPGTGKSGDFPPRPECAQAWRTQLLDYLQAVDLTLVVGQYALKYHLLEAQGNLTEVVRNWRDYYPQTIPLPHPSPRNNIWLKRNPWFERDVVPALQARVAALI